MRYVLKKNIINMSDAMRLTSNIINNNNLQINYCYVNKFQPYNHYIVGI